MPDPIAIFEDVTYFYPGAATPALSEVNLSLREGEIFGLIGPTGAGKSTLCRALNGIVPQFFGGRFFGNLVVAGLDVLAHPVSRLAQSVGQVFEDIETQLITTSVENEIAFMLENLKIPRDEMRQRITQALDTVRMTGMEKKHPAELSGGQKQRLAIAAALAARPRLLVLDEPTSQLDPVGGQEVFATILQLNREMGMTILITGHAAEELAACADRIGVLSGGALIAIGSPEDVYARVAYLQQHALRPPQVAESFSLLHQGGLPVPKIPVTLPAAKMALQQLLAVEVPVALPEFSQPRAKRTSQTLITVQDLEYTYPDGTRALQGLSLEIHRGEYVLIIGQNGAGKSTLVKHFVNLLQPTAGQVKINGVTTRELAMSDLASHIGYIGQNPDSQIFNMTVEDEVAFALRNLKLPKESVANRTEENLKAMGLYDQRKMHPLALPRGDRARVVIAAILAMNPEMVIFDEPTTGQDHRGAQLILNISRNLHRMGKTVVVITHHLHLMPDYAERVIVMGQGDILVDAPIREAFYQTEKLESTYLAPPQVVQLAGELSRIMGEVFPLLTPTEFAACFLPKETGGAQ